MNSSAEKYNNKPTEHGFATPLEYLFQGVNHFESSVPSLSGSKPGGLIDH